MVVSLVVEAFDSGVFEGAVHALELAIGPGMLGLGQAMIDVVLGAGVLEGMRPEQFATLDGQLDFRRGRAGISRRSEVGAVIGKHGVDLIRNGLEQGPEKIAGNARRVAFSCN